MEDISRWNKDLLTKCYPRQYLQPYLEKLKIDYNLNAKPFSVMMVDLDHFKPMNDKYGHSCGDSMIQYFSSSLRLYLENEYISAQDHNHIFRYGGDEFLAVFPGQESRDVAIIANRILKEGMKKKRQFLYHGRSFKITFSGGIASFPADAKQADELVRKADEAMYFSKKHGKARISVYSTMRFENIRMKIGGFLVVIGFLLSFLVIFLSFQGAIDNFIFVDRVFKFDFPHPEKLKRIYLKTGAVIEGIVADEKDPLRIKLIMDNGEGTILLNKSEIKKIVP